MKKIIVVLILLLVSAISYAEFSYQRGSFSYNKCKVKIISSDALVNRQQYLEREINTFCNNKDIIDIKFQEDGNTTALIIYKEK